MCNESSEFYAQQKSAFFDFLKLFISDRVRYQSKKIIFVSNEVGHGIVPMGELSRQFVDQAGWLHQELAELADQVDFVMAGLLLTLKPNSIQSHSLQNEALEKKS